MYEIVSIPSIDDAENRKYGLLPLIEDAMIYAEEALYSAGRELSNDSACYEQVTANIKANFLTARFRTFDEALKGYAASREMCLESALDFMNYVVDFLEVNEVDIFPQDSSPQINLSILYAGDYLKHFGHHFVVLVEDLLEGSVYLLSPSNVFNDDGSLPYLKDSPFIRTKDLIASDTREGAMMGLNAVEVENEEKVDWREVPFTEELRHKPLDEVFLGIYEAILANR